MGKREKGKGYGWKKGEWLWVGKRGKVNSGEKMKGLKVGNRGRVRWDKGKG